MSPQKSLEEWHRHSVLKLVGTNLGTCGVASEFWGRTEFIPCRPLPVSDTEGRGGGGGFGEEGIMGREAKKIWVGRENENLYPPLPPLLSEMVPDKY